MILDLLNCRRAGEQVSETDGPWRISTPCFHGVMNSLRHRKVAHVFLISLSSYMFCPLRSALPLSGLPRFQRPVQITLHSRLLQFRLPQGLPASFLYSLHSCVCIKNVKKHCVRTSVLSATLKILNHSPNGYLLVKAINLLSKLKILAAAC